MGKARDKVNGKEQEGAGGKDLSKEGKAKGSRKQQAVKSGVADNDGLLPKKRVSEKRGLHP